MTTKRITQSEAQALRKRVALLEAREEDRRTAWVKDYPGGTYIGSVVLGEGDAARIRTARVLRHAVVVTNGNVSELNLYAMPVAKDADA